MSFLREATVQVKRLRRRRFAAHTLFGVECERLELLQDSVTLHHNQYGVTALRGGHFTYELTARGAVTSLRAARFQFCILADCS